MINCNQTAQTQYIVKRWHEADDDGYNGGKGYDTFVATEHPNPGEEIYHGPFKKISHEIDNGPMGSSYWYTYQPVDMAKITHETYNGPGNGDVQVF